MKNSQPVRQKKKIDNSSCTFHNDDSGLRELTRKWERQYEEKKFIPMADMDRAWLFVSGTWYDRNCTSYPANRSILYGNTVLLCKEF